MTRFHSGTLPLDILLAVLISGCSHCDRAERVLAREGQDGRAIVSNFSDCTSAFAGTELDDEIYLVDIDGRRSLVFKYAPNPGIIVSKLGSEESVRPISAIWLSSGEVELSVGAVAQIEVQKEEVRGVRFKFKVGAVIYDTHHL